MENSENLVLRTKHFSANELRCHCGNCIFSGMNSDYMEKVEAIRTDPAWGNKPMNPSSAFRCQDHNKYVSKTGGNGPHTKLRAIDFLCSSEEAIILEVLGYKHGMTGFGISQKGDYKKRFIHLDDLDNKKSQPRPHKWSY